MSENEMKAPANSKHEKTQNLRAYVRQRKMQWHSCVCVCVCVSQVCTDDGQEAGECISLPQISTVALGLSQPSSHLNNMHLFPEMLLRGSFLSSSYLLFPLAKPAIILAPSYPVALPFHHNDVRELELRLSTHSVR